jgi:hypothetical protein
LVVSTFALGKLAKFWILGMGKTGLTAEPWQAGYCMSVGHKQSAAAPGALRLVCGDAATESSKGRSEQRNEVFIVEASKQRMTKVEHNTANRGSQARKQVRERYRGDG